MRDICSGCGKDKRVVALSDGVTLICKECFDIHTAKSLKELMKRGKDGQKG